VIQRDELLTPEDGLDLENREPKRRARRPAAPDISAAAAATSDPEVAAALARIAAARRLQPPPVTGCGDCWQAGRDAAVAAVADPTIPADGVGLALLRERLRAARGLLAPGLHWQACWVAGRDAALRAIEGR
jgi:hypothetical protein